MINANELRIGNWVLDYNDEPVLVLNIAEEGINQRYFADDNCFARIRYEDLQPMPLTPELLDKAGFEDSYIEQTIDGLIHIRRCTYINKLGLIQNHNRFHVMIDYSELSTVDEIDARLNTYSKGTPTSINKITKVLRYGIKYIHQLQNLYFTLTDEELNITL